MIGGEHLVERNHSQSVMIAWVKSHAGVSRDQPEVELLMNILWSLNWSKEPLTRVKHNAGVKGHIGSCRVNQSSNCLGILYGH